LLALGSAPVPIFVLYHAHIAHVLVFKVEMGGGGVAVSKYDINYQFFASFETMLRQKIIRGGSRR